MHCRYLAEMLRQDKCNHFSDYFNFDESTNRRNAEKMTGGKSAVRYVGERRIRLSAAREQKNGRFHTIAGIVGCDNVVGMGC